MLFYASIFIADLVRFNTNFGGKNIAGSKLKHAGISGFAVRCLKD
jgi:hypothetical protein